MDQFNNSSNNLETRWYNNKTFQELYKNHSNSSSNTPISMILTLDILSISNKFNSN
jgi:hypothetical protein